MNLSKYYPFFIGVCGFPLEVVIGNVFNFLYFNVYQKETSFHLTFLGTICKVGEYKQTMFPYFLFSFIMLLLIFLLAVVVKNNLIRYACASYFVFISFALFILPLPNISLLFYLRSLFISSSFIQILSFFLFSNYFFLYIIPLLFSIIILKMQYRKGTEFVSFLIGCLLSLVGSFGFFYGMSFLKLFN